MEKDYMLVPCEIKGIKEDKEEGYVYVDGYASIYDNIDLGDDRVRPSFFVDDLKENGNKRPALWQHMSSEPVGVKEYETDNIGLKFRAKLPMDDTFVMGRVYPQMKVGSVTGVSIGYWTFDEEYNREARCNDLIRGALRESSFVTFPMNPKAQIYSVRKQVKGLLDGSIKSENNEMLSPLMEFAKNLGIKCENRRKATIEITMHPMAEEKTEWDPVDAVNGIKENTDSIKSPSAQFSKGFMFCDSGKSDSFDSYKIPYVKWIDGGFKTVPRAIYDITAKLAAGRKNMGIPGYAIDGIKDFANQVYKKLGNEEPFKAEGKCFIDTATLKSMEKQDTLAILGNPDIILSTNAKELIADALRCPPGGGSVSNEKSNGDDVLAALKEMNTIL